eukprot:TRINITY_DN6580_c0_g1_i7.p1 TRINITY_DN6580_c0_g1~~TRINITY_DN6580_c0_g1_i7.p1  ORF type:complete len:208 (+),score=-6.67 TRINITY_DN6580_c0_g1_i7:366-989(+)
MFLLNPLKFLEIRNILYFKESCEISIYFIVTTSPKNKIQFLLEVVHIIIKQGPLSSGIYLMSYSLKIFIGCFGKKNYCNDYIYNHQNHDIMQIVKYTIAMLTVHNYFSEQFQYKTEYKIMSKLGLCCAQNILRVSGFIEYQYYYYFPSKNKKFQIQVQIPQTFSKRVNHEKVAGKIYVKQKQLIQQTELYFSGVIKTIKKIKKFQKV